MHSSCMSLQKLQLRHMQATQYSSILCMQVTQRLQVKQHLLVLMQVTRVTNYNTGQLQVTQCIIISGGSRLLQREVPLHTDSQPALI